MKKFGIHLDVSFSGKRMIHVHCWSARNDNILLWKSENHGEMVLPSVLHVDVTCLAKTKDGGRADGK